MAASDSDRAFLLELLGPPPRNASVEQPASRVVNWARLLQLAGPLQPMLALRTAERRIPVPPAVRERLDGARRAAAMLHAHRRFAMGRVFAALDDASIPFVVLKGYVLAHTAYPSPETRVMSDVDLWFGGADLRAAARALEKLGWRTPWWRKGDARFFVDGESVALHLGSTALMIELHRQPASLAEVIPAELDAIWSRRTLIDLGGWSVSVLAFDDSLLHLTLHLAQHHRFVNALGRLVDIHLALTAAGPSFDWPGFVRRCRTLGVQGWVAVTLGTAKAMLQANVSDEVLRDFDVQGLPALVAMACDQVWLTDRSAVAPSSVLAAPTRRARAQLMGRRIRELLVGRGVTYRLRLTLLRTLPALVRALWRGTYRGESGARLRRLSEDNQVLAESLRRQAIADGATPR